MRRALALAFLFGAVLLAVAGAGSASSNAKALVTVAVGGKGTLTSTPGGIHCPRHCRTFVNLGVALHFVATPAKGWKIEKWTGMCPKSLLRTCTAKVAHNPLGGRIVFEPIRPPAPKAPTPPPTSRTKPAHHK
ncbi:MAG TPA: hypothetical protein VFW85_10005 [Gaiellaceae bacterium]|nr:hypothetical protein [Gaiellaceae bacterium]